MDLGTSRTHIAVPGQPIWLDEPTLLALDRHGRPVAAGWQAWQAGVEGSVVLRYPVRQGRIVDPVWFVQFLTLLLQQTGLTGAETVAVAIPALSLDRDADLLAVCVSAVTGAPVVRVDAAVACAESLGVGSDAAHLVVDVGAGICEVAAVWDGQAQAHGRADVGAAEFVTDPSALLIPLTAATHQVLCDLPTEISQRLRSQPAHLVGGGPLLPGLTDAVRAALSLEVVVPPEPRTCLIRGLSDRLAALTHA